MSGDLKYLMEYKPLFLIFVRLSVICNVYAQSTSSELLVRKVETFLHQLS